MNPDLLIEQLSTNSQRIKNLVDSVSVEQARWKPAQVSWSIIEVINHLFDEERFDFRRRLDLIFFHPDDPWTRINPGAWVTERRYNERDLHTSIQDYLNERKNSLDWLHSLSSLDWTTAIPAPWGTIAAGDILSAWVVHDTLHMRQLVELIHDYIVYLSQPYSQEYAGDW